MIRKHKNFYLTCDEHANETILNILTLCKICTWVVLYIMDAVHRAFEHALTIEHEFIEWIQLSLHPSDLNSYCRLSHT